MQLETQKLPLSVGEHKRTLLIPNLNLSFTQGALTTLIGLNGSGKSTLLRYLVGLNIPEKNKRNNKEGGKVLLNKRDLQSYSLRELARVMAYLPQHTPLYHDMQVKELVVLGCAAQKSPFHLWSNNDYERAYSNLEWVGMQHYFERQIFTLSGGEQQRVWLARMLMSDASIYIMDEPTTSLDLQAALEFLELCRKLCKQGLTIICSLHDLNLTRSYADYVICLDRKESKYYANTTKNIFNAKLISNVFGVSIKMQGGILAHA